MIEILLEGRDAPLYHCTSVLSAVRIIDNDRLKPSDRFSSLTGDKRGTISFTRDKSYSVSGDAMIRLEFDQRKLAQNYKFIPIAEPGYSRESGWTESEERLISDKPIPVLKYLKEIEVTPSFESDIKARLGYIYDTPRDRWDNDDKAMHKLWLWWENGDYKFGKNISKIFKWFSTMIAKDLYGDSWKDRDLDLIVGGMK